MFPSSGYFKALTCPFYASGLCERPYCHFRHVKPTQDEKLSSPSWSSTVTPTTSSDGNSSLLARVGETIQKLQRDIERDQQLLDGHKNLKPRSIQAFASSTAEKFRTRLTLADAKKVAPKEEPPVVEFSYKPTPICELKKKRSEKYKIESESDKQENNDVDRDEEYQPEAKKLRLSSRDEEPVGKFSDGESSQASDEEPGALFFGKCEKNIETEEKEEERESEEPAKSVEPDPKLTPAAPGDILSRIMQDSSQSLNLSNVQHRKDGSIVILGEVEKLKRKVKKTKRKNLPTAAELCLELSDEEMEEIIEKVPKTEIVPIEAEVSETVEREEHVPTEDLVKPNVEELELTKKRESVWEMIKSGAIVIGHIPKDNYLEPRTEKAKPEKKGGVDSNDVTSKLENERKNDSEGKSIEHIGKDEPGKSDEVGDQTKIKGEPDIEMTFMVEKKNTDEALEEKSETEVVVDSESSSSTDTDSGHRSKRKRSKKDKKRKKKKHRKKKKKHRKKHRRKHSGSESELSTDDECAKKSSEKSRSRGHKKKKKRKRYSSTSSSDSDSRSEKSEHRTPGVERLLTIKPLEQNAHAASEAACDEEKLDVRVELHLQNKNDSDNKISSRDSIEDKRHPSGSMSEGKCIAELGKETENEAKEVKYSEMKGGMSREGGQESKLSTSTKEKTKAKDEDSSKGKIEGSVRGSDSIKVKVEGSANTSDSVKVKVEGSVKGSDSVKVEYHSPRKVAGEFDLFATAEPDCSADSSHDSDMDMKSPLKRHESSKKKRSATAHRPKVDPVRSVSESEPDFPSFREFVQGSNCVSSPRNDTEHNAEELSVTAEHTEHKSQKTQSSLIKSHDQSHRVRSDPNRKDQSERSGSGKSEHSKDHSNSDKTKTDQKSSHEKTDRGVSHDGKIVHQSGHQKTDQKPGHGKTEPKSDHGKSDPKFGHGKTDHGSGHGKTEHKSSHGKTDHKSSHEETDHKSGHGKTDHKSGHGKTDHKSGHGKTDHKSGHGKTDHRSGRGKSDRGKTSKVIERSSEKKSDHKSTSAKDKSLYKSRSSESSDKHGSSTSFKSISDHARTKEKSHSSNSSHHKSTSHSSPHTSSRPGSHRHCHTKSEHEEAVKFVSELSESNQLHSVQYAEKKPKKLSERCSSEKTCETPVASTSSGLGLPSSRHRSTTVSSDSGARNSSAKVAFASLFGEESSDDDIVYIGNDDDEPRLSMSSSGSRPLFPSPVYVGSGNTCPKKSARAPSRHPIDDVDWEEDPWEEGSDNGTTNEHLYHIPKKRIAHPEADVSRAPARSAMSRAHKTFLSPAEQLHNRFKLVQQKAQSCSSAITPKHNQGEFEALNVPKKVRVAHATKWKKGEPTPVQTSKAGKREAHIPQERIFARPIIPNAYGSKVPTSIRQRYLNQLIDECLKIYNEQQAAFDRALSEEKSIYDRSTSRVVYLNVAVKVIRVLRSEIAGQGGSSSQQKQGKKWSHEAVLGGAKAAKTTFTLHRSGHGIKANSQVELILGVFSEYLQQYLLSEEQLKDNGFPVFDPDAPDLVKFYGGRDTTPNKGLKLHEKLCCRCGKRFRIYPDGTYGTKEECSYHWGRSYKRKVSGQWDSRYNCCSGDLNSDPCCSAKYHVHDTNKANDLKGYVRTYARPPSSDGYGIYALDCEMIYTIHGCELARVTVVDMDLKPVYETLVKPTSEIIDYNTRFSGLEEGSLTRVNTTLADVQNKLRRLFSEKTILLGHSLESDFTAMKLVHQTVVDTSVVFPHRLGPPYKRALRTLMGEILEKIIQNDLGGHDSREDAAACMELMIWKVKEELRVKH